MGLFKNKLKNHIRKGVKLANSKNYNAAIKNFNKALELKPDYYHAMLYMGASYFNKGDYPKAKEWLKKSINFSSFEEAYHKLGLIFLMEQEYDKVIEYETHALQIKNDFFEAYYPLALAYFEKKDFNNAILFSNKALKSKPNNKNLYNILGLSLFRKERNQEAKYYLSEASKLGDKQSTEFLQAHTELDIEYTNDIINIAGIILLGGKGDNEENAIIFYPENIELLKKLYLKAINKLNNSSFKTNISELYEANEGITISYIVKMRYIEGKYGKEDEKWKLGSRFYLKNHIQIQEIIRFDGQKTIFYFDFSELIDSSMEKTSNMLHDYSTDNNVELLPKVKLGPNSSLKQFPLLYLYFDYFYEIELAAHNQLICVAVYDKLYSLTEVLTNEDLFTRLYEKDNIRIKLNNGFKIFRSIEKDYWQMVINPNEKKESLSKIQNDVIRNSILENYKEIEPKVKEIRKRYELFFYE